MSLHYIKNDAIMQNAEASNIIQTPSDGDKTLLQL